MPQFPIEYSQRIPNPPSAAAPIVADTAAPYEAIARFGQAIFQVGRQIQQAEEEIEISTLRRKTEEMWNSAYQTAIQENDPEKRQAIYNKFLEDIQTIPVKSDRVRQEHQLFLNEALPKYQVYFYELDQKKRIQSAKSELEVNGQYFLEKGDLESYNSLIDKGMQSGLLAPAEHEYLKKNAQTESVLAQARILMNDNPQRAIQILENLSGLSAEQLDRKDRLVGHARTLMNWRQEQTDNEEISIILDMHKNLHLSPQEKFRLGELYLERLAQSGITGERMGVMVDRIEKWQQGKRYETDPIVRSELFEKAVDIWRGHLTLDELKKELQQKWQQGLLNESDYNYIWDTATRTLKTSQASAIADAVKNAKYVLVDFAEKEDFEEFLKNLKSKKDQEKALQKRQLQFWHLSQYEQELQNWLRENPNASVQELRTQAEMLQYQYMNWSTEEIQTKLKQRMMNISLPKKPEFEVGQKIVKDGIIYTYVGNGKWEY
ncbi:MAG TPA: hypothetical protein PLV55_06025 [Anaerohalosphaeraceae bacterium]|nr:hypothetical protein [Anaerohalosphaeraceae bacterium]